jgi:methylthioribose-1-phosphate isomerase
MLKEKMKETLLRAELEIKSLKRSNHEILDEVKSARKELKLSESHADELTEQLKRISQSVYTVLQVRHPDGQMRHETCEISEEERFLVFLHGLCGNYRSGAGRSFDFQQTHMR